MTITTRWYDDEKRAVYCLFEGKWTWDELFKAFAETDELAESVDYPVKVVIDVHRTQHVPVLSPTAMSKLASLTNNRTEKVAGMVFTGARGFVKAMYDVFSRIYPKAAEKYQFADTVDELEAIINKTTT